MRLSARGGRLSLSWAAYRARTVAGVVRRRSGFGGEPRALLALRHATPREEGQKRRRATLLIAVVEVVGVRGVEVDGLLDQSQPEHLGVEVDVALRLGCDRGDMVQPVRTDVGHRRYLLRNTGPAGGGLGSAPDFARHGVGGRLLDA